DSALALVWQPAARTTALFPYTTLFRSRPAPRHAPHHGRSERVQQAPRQPAEGHAARPGRLRARPPAPRPPDGTARQFATGPAARSEEHTSELQSRVDLVCRLLLEKKNN